MPIASIEPGQLYGTSSAEADRFDVQAAINGENTDLSFIQHGSQPPRCHFRIGRAQTLLQFARRSGHGWR
jgi:hypothetical protein